MAPNDEVERRGASPASNEGTLSQSSIPSLAQRRCAPRSLEPIVRCPATACPFGTSSNCQIRRDSPLHRTCISKMPPESRSPRYLALLKSPQPILADPALPRTLALRALEQAGNRAPSHLQLFQLAQNKGQTALEICSTGLRLRGKRLPGHLCRE